MEHESVTTPHSTPPRGEALSPELRDAIRSTHEDLSPLAWRFLEHVRQHPEATQAIDYRRAEPLPDWAHRYPFPLQPWPTFVDARKLRQIELATVGLTELVKSIPQRFFGGQTRRIGEFYGVTDELLIRLLLSPPNAIAASFARCDFVDDGSDFRCLELNFGGNLGGWQARFFEAVCRAQPSTAAFLATERAQALHRDPWVTALSLVVAEGCRSGHDTAGCFNVAIAKPDQADSETIAAVIDDLWQEVLRASGTGCRGKAVICTYPHGLTARGGALFHQGLRINAVIEATALPTPRDVFLCFKGGTVGLFSGPVSGLLGDKRNLALLSMHEQSDLLTAAEREVVRRHVPWSRLVADERTTYRGESVRLLDLAAARRESLVLKPVDGSQGRNVHLGSRTTPGEWQRLLDQAAGTRQTLLQEYVASRPYLYQHGDPGCAPHQVIWGTFSLGGSYGGGFLRMLPLDRGPGVINSARGATEGLIFEVQPRP
jgi:hypothetical protein